MAQTTKIMFRMEGQTKLIRGNRNNCQLLKPERSNSTRVFKIKKCSPKMIAIIFSIHNNYKLMTKRTNKIMNHVILLIRNKRETIPKTIVKCKVNNSQKIKIITANNPQI